MRRRIIIVLFCLAAIWFAALIRMVVEVVFTDPHRVEIKLYSRNDNKARTIIFPDAFRRKWRIDIINPPGTMEVGPKKFLLDEAKCIVFWDGKYYWIGENQIIDFATPKEIEIFPVISGLSFVNTESGYTLLDVDEPFFNVLDAIYSNNALLKRLSAIDYKSRTLFFRRGIVLKVFKWDSLVEKQSEVLEEIVKAEDMSEYLLFSDGKLMRVR
ncbi:DUF4894 domain-containing protein [Kosmotoga pacifica]|uniref:POTRA domain-containing protein n=1 Tax=Kosmotoga pacifica TaxID=1330330 RepID=A0A0G2Z995_9BACT|nr:DUF4894 domain-containing protein [Kosmotoga pacifica]AKI98132.1 hypothetical protein IX53_10170 [Kosmotoga pacifica]